MNKNYSNPSTVIFSRGQRKIENKFTKTKDSLDRYFDAAYSSGKYLEIEMTNCAFKKPD